MTAKTAVLIGFADSLSAPEVVWSLTGAGFQVVSFAKAKTRPALLQSRFAEVKYITDPADSSSGAISDLQHIVEEIGTPLLMPLDDESLWLMQELSKRIPLRVAGATGYPAQVALDKRLQVKAAIEAGFSVPETMELNSQPDLERWKTSFPAIVKPALAARTSGPSLGRGRAHVIADSEELQSFASVWSWTEPMLIQPLIKGTGEGVFGFALEDGVVCWSAHRRIRMMNPSGSGASACVSAKPSPEIRTQAERFLKAIEWRGMFMIELLRADSGQLWFMELNGRSWGSMALARRAGFEYPAWNAKRLIDPTFVPQAPAEQPSLVCRHLGRELLHLAFVWRGPKSRASTGWPRRTDAMRQVLRLRRNEYWYNYSKDDPRVFFADTWQTLISTVLSKKRTKNSASIARRITNRLERPLVRHEQAKLRAEGKVSNLLKRCKSLLFLCYGNINRSALAEQHLRQLMGSTLKISSCGFHSQERRPIDPVMRSVAKEFGIQFPVWSSRRISSELVENADVIFAMEASHLVRLYQEYPEARGRAVLLSCATKPKTIPLEIQDPFGGSPEIYKRCVEEVTFATAAISEILKQ